MTAPLNLFPSRIPIGKWRDPISGKDIPVNMTSEFERALAALLQRVGGPVSLSLDDVLALTAIVDTPPGALRADLRVAALEQEVAVLRGQLAQTAVLARRLDDLERQTAQGSSSAMAAQLSARLEGLERTASRGPILPDWEHPGKIGASTPNSIKATTVTTAGGAQLIATFAALNNGAAAAIGTLANAPAAGNPTKWVPINDNGTIRYVPAW